MDAVHQEWGHGDQYGHDHRRPVWPLIWRRSGTVTNSGTISGAASVVFAGSGTNTLTLQTGSTLVGARLWQHGFRRGQRLDPGGPWNG